MSFVKKNSTSIQKSGTSYNLPSLENPYNTLINNKSKNISSQKSYKSSRSLAQKNNSYLEQLEKLNLQNQYQQIDFGYLNSEQKKLKCLLKKMNLDTFKMVQSYKSKPKKITKQSKRTISQMQMINQQQQLTNNKLIQILHYEIKKLQQRSEYLITNNLSKDNYIQKIQTIKGQIRGLKSVNFVQKHQITKMSKTLQIQNDHDEQKNNIEKLQNELKAVLSKKYKFKTQQKRMIEQEAKLKENKKQLSEKLQEIKKAPQYQKVFFQSTSNQKIDDKRIDKNLTLNYSQNQRQIQTQTQSILQNKKQYLEALKKKQQSVNERNQQKYFRVLKQLQQIQQSNSTADEKITQIEGKILQYKQIVRQKQFKLFVLKEKKKMQVNQVNQFLLNSRLQEIDQPEQKLKHFKNQTQHQSQILDQNQFQEKKYQTQKDVGTGVQTIKTFKKNLQINPEQEKAAINMTESKLV